MAETNFSTTECQQQPPPTPHRVYHRPAWYSIPGKVFLGCLTAPYRRTFKLYTWKPLKEIRAADGDRRVLCSLVADWREDKYQELQSVQVASSFCAGASLATLAWNQEQNPHWAASALWYSSLSCSIWAIITSIQQKSILDDLPPTELLNDALPEYDFNRTRRVILRYKKRPGMGHWIMLFFWQFPSMQMSYAWCTFLAGLTVYILTPFIRRKPWSDDSKIAIVYLVVAGVGLITFLTSSAFVYSSEKACEQSTTNTRSNTIEAGIGSFKPPSGNSRPSGAESTATNGHSTTNVAPTQTLKTRALLIDSSRQGPQSGRQFSDSSKKKALLM